MAFGSRWRARQRVNGMPSIAVLAGDGIGPEVTESAIQVMDALTRLGYGEFDWDPGLIGGSAIDAVGDAFPPATERLVHEKDAVLLGAVGGPQWAGVPDTPEQGLLRLRQSLGLFANIRPFEMLPGLEASSPLRRPFTGGVVVRELLGGLYYGKPRGRQDDHAFDTARYSVEEIERIARIGFQIAQERGVALVSVDKANVLETSKLWRTTVTALGEREYPQVRLEHRYVDAAAMEMVLAPDHFRVVVTGNLFGDILSDLTGGLVGSLGVLGSATLGQWGRGRGLYEPVHGSAPDIVGQGVANPIGAIGSLAMMLQWSLDLPQAAQVVQQAVRAVVKAGICTPDIGGRASTHEVTQAVIRQLTFVPQGR